MVAADEKAPRSAVPAETIEKNFMFSRLYDLMQEIEVC